MAVQNGNLGTVVSGFDPDRDLDCVGLANQTTMLRDETLQIGKLLEKAVMTRHGPANLKKHYMVLDTICDATQVSCPSFRPIVLGCAWVMREDAYAYQVAQDVTWIVTRPHKITTDLSALVACRQHSRLLLLV